MGYERMRNATKLRNAKYECFNMKCKYVFNQLHSKFYDCDYGPSSQMTLSSHCSDLRVQLLSLTMISIIGLWYPAKPFTELCFLQTAAALLYQ